jgi:energy-coupling factor transporter ATP-binding protein EcfA2
LDSEIIIGHINQLKLENVSLTYGKKTIVSDLNYCFNKGGVNLIVGRAGSGKSSLLLFLAGFLKDAQGDVYADQAPFESEGRFSLAFQSPESLFFNPTVGDEVCFALQMRNVPADEAIAQGKLWLSKWGLDPAKYWDRSTLALSGGEKRRVALAACTVFKPPLIMLDEPLAGLDIEGQINLAKLIEEMAQEACVLVVTHEPEIFLRPTTQILYIREGRGDNFDGASFYDASINDEDFYPLPNWFKANNRFKKAD